VARPIKIWVVAYPAHPAAPRMTQRIKITLPAVIFAYTVPEEMNSEPPQNVPRIKEDADEQRRPITRPAVNFVGNDDGKD